LATAGVIYLAGLGKLALSSSNSHGHNVLVTSAYSRKASCLSVRLPPYISTAPTGRISTKFDTGDFYENLLRNSQFGYNWTKISGTLLEDGSVYFLAAGGTKSP